MYVVIRKYVYFILSIIYGLCICLTKFAINEDICDNSRRQHRKDNYLHLKPFRGNNNIMNLIIHMIYIYTTFF